MAAVCLVLAVLFAAILGMAGFGWISADHPFGWLGLSLAFGWASFLIGHIPFGRAS